MTRRPIFRDKFLAPINHIARIRGALRQHPYKKVPHSFAKNASKIVIVDQISPEETGLTNSVAATALQRPLFIQGKHLFSNERRIYKRKLF
jgi:hypothetical protein